VKLALCRSGEGRRRRIHGRVGGVHSVRGYASIPLPNR
jgi:hypothetical protein